MNEKTKKYLESQKEELKRQINDISSDFCGDYGDITQNNYICDAITEYADNQVDINATALLEWAVDNYEYVEQAIDEFGVSKDSNGRADFLRTIAAGQFFKNEEELNQDIEEIVQLLAINYLLKNEIEIEEEVLEDMLKDLKHYIYSNDHFSDILDKIEEYTNKDEE